MRFGAQLKESLYKPWADSYIDYKKLKKLLREDEAEKKGDKWTDDDENHFTEELLNTQLEKVNAFQSDKYQSLRQRTTECEQRLKKASQDGKEKPASEGEEVIKELDDITKEISELEKYSRVNYTGFLKAAKKHDRRRGAKYKVRPLLQVRLAALPFNSEDYSPLLYEISEMYAFARGTTEIEEGQPKPRSESKSEGDKYTSYKFWVHADNLVEVKTIILRRLPVLVYNPQISKTVESGGSDPTLSSLYFDSEKFSLYNDKIDKIGQVSSFRLRWFGQLNDKPEIFLEKKTVDESDSEDIRVSIKDKYIQSFLAGEYHFDKDLEKLNKREGSEGDGYAKLKHNVQEIQSFINDNELQPMLRANYTRTAFQIPGDSRVRISIDTDLAFIREDSLNADRLCRRPGNWHRTDIDTLGLKFPFSGINDEEVARFPHAVLEIKVRSGVSKRTMDWINELMSSHLVKPAPKFSKFVHGVAQLFDDNVNSFPFWLSDLETDIRQDPQDAYREEQEKKAAQIANEQAVGSFLGSSPRRSTQAIVGSPMSQHLPEDRRDSVATIKPAKPREDKPSSSVDEQQASGGGGASSMFSFGPFSTTKFARAHRRGQVTLPPGVTKPETWIKDAFTASVEPKVWLANERTLVKWQHVGVLLASLSLALFNSAGATNSIARGLAGIYTLIALFTLGWGWWMYIVRSRMIKARSGKDFDNPVGPVIVCIGLTFALIVNFVLKVSKSCLALVYIV